MTANPFKPTREQLAASQGKTVPDLLAPDLRVLFVGINPGLYSAAISHHFGRPGNRFWPALFASGFVPRLLSPFEEGELLALRLGVTNIVSRASARATNCPPRNLRRRDYPDGQGAEIPAAVCRLPGRDRVSGGVQSAQGGNRTASRGR